jgi:hypothetical protein
VLQLGNKKLGDGIWSFSLPIEKSCKSATSLCGRACYAKAGHFAWPSVHLSHRRAWEASAQQDFADQVVAFCEKKGVKTVRVHVSGDFYSQGYVEKWADAATRLSGVTFLAYTRRWRDPRMFGALGAFGSLANVFLWLSADAETGEPPRPAWSAGVAYMSLSDQDLPPYPVDLVFRDSDKTVMRKTPAGARVCPTDDGVARSAKVTCSACKFCFRPGRTPVLGSRTPLPVL